MRSTGKFVIKMSNSENYCSDQSELLYLKCCIIYKVMIQSNHNIIYLLWPKELCPWWGGANMIFVFFNWKTMITCPSLVKRVWPKKNQLHEKKVVDPRLDLVNIVVRLLLFTKLSLFTTYSLDTNMKKGAGVYSSNRVFH